MARVIGPGRLTNDSFCHVLTSSLLSALLLIPDTFSAFFLVLHEIISAFSSLMS